MLPPLIEHTLVKFDLGFGDLFDHLMFLDANEARPDHTPPSMCPRTEPFNFNIIASYEPAEVGVAGDQLACVISFFVGEGRIRVRVNRVIYDVTALDGDLVNNALIAIAIRTQIIRAGGLSRCLGFSTRKNGP